MDRSSVFRAALALTMVGASSCTTPAGNLAHKKDPDRKIASVKQFFETKGAECLTRVPELFSDEMNFSLDDANPDSFEAWVDRGVDEGALSPSLPSQLERFNEDQKTEALTLALTEAFTYGATLQQEFDRLIAKGYTLERIQKESMTYAKLRALYFVRHEVTELVHSRFRKGYFERAYENMNGKGADFDPAFYTRDYIGRFYDRIHSAVDTRVKDPRISVLALNDVDHFLTSAIRGTSGCSNTSPTLSFVNDQKVMQIAKGFTPDLGRFKTFQSQHLLPDLSVERLVTHRAKALGMVGRTPQSELEESQPGTNEVWGDVYTPSAGKKGNVIGGAFPKGAWALTFDDGPIRLRGGDGKSIPTSEQVLENLRKHGMKATFFILSQQIEPHRFGDIARMEAEQGHAVESHSYTHPQFLRLSAAQKDYEVNGAVRKFKEVLGFGPRFFRLPYGEGVNNAGVRKIIADAEMVHVYWNVDSLDWQDKNPDSIVRRVTTQMQNQSRGVILFHDVHTQSVIASERIMAHLKNPDNGLRPVTIPEIVDELNARAKAGGATPTGTVPTVSSVNPPAQKMTDESPKEKATSRTEWTF